jgi:hypothetical protein
VIVIIGGALVVYCRGAATPCIVIQRTIFN